MAKDQTVVLITGAASGIGRETALAFAAVGARVALVDVDQDAGLAFQQELQNTGTEAMFIAADVTLEHDVARAVASTVDYFGRLDVGFNNAGIELENAPLGECPADIFDRVMAVNVRGVFLFMKYEIQQMLRQDNGGHIINTASAAGLIAAPNRSAYTASKHAVIGLTKAAAVEYGKQRLHINAICPGVVETDMYRKAMAGQKDARKALEASLPLGRAASTREIAQTVLWLSSEDARYIQGHALPIDGGVVAT